MVQINFAQKQVNAKVVYYGPGMSGKTTNLEVIHERAPENNRGELTSISTEGDRTLFFDFMPLDLGTVSGMRTCFQIYTVPGQVYYNSTRKLVLQGVDGVIFVADSSPNMMEENLESLANLAENLAEYGRSISEMPLVIQYNKRDVPGACSIEELEEKLNPTGVPAFEAIANTGKGVFPTLKAVAATVLDSLHKQQSSVRSGSSAASSVPQSPASVQPVAEVPSPPAPVPAPLADGSGSALPLMRAPLSPRVEAGAAPVPAASAPERPTISMSQTGFHKAPSVSLPKSEPAPAAPAPVPDAPVAPGVELRIATPNHAKPEVPPAVPTQPLPQGGLAASQNLQIQRSQPVAPTQPQAPVQQAPQATQEVRVGAGGTPSSMMEVESGAAAPQRRVPATRSFPTRPAMPEPRATARQDRSALVTGLIIVASVATGAVLGSLVLHLF
jgi:signal recognition particle receptor subunit beta